jgi:hypothetical protein
MERDNCNPADVSRGMDRNCPFMNKQQIPRRIAGDMTKVKMRPWTRKTTASTTSKM